MYLLKRFFCTMLFQNIIKVLLLQVLLLSAFAGFYSLGRQYAFSENAEAVFPKSYKRIGGWDDFKIIQSDTTFTKVTANNMLAWDAAIYNCMAQHGYQQNKNCYDVARLAFYPAFPLLWRSTSLNAVGISILNFLLFGFSLALVATAFKQKLNLFKTLLLISLPGFIVFGMPYTEALFVFFGALAFYFYTVHKYWFSGFALIGLALTRPAGFMFLAALLIIFTLYFITTRFKTVPWKKLLWSLPFGLAWIITKTLQWYQTGVDTGLSNSATSLWEDRWGIPNALSGWTYESFSLSIFVLMAVLIPSVFYLLRAVWLTCVLKKIANHSKTLFIQVAIFYLATLSIFLFFQTQGSLHGLFRFALCSPAFLILVVGVKLNKAGARLWILTSSLMAISLLLSVEYAGHSWQPEFNGLPLLALSILLLFTASFKGVLQQSLTIILVLLNIAFNAHLYDMFLSNAWVWT